MPTRPKLPGLSIIDDCGIENGPRGQLGRFFLRAETLLQDEGLHVRVVRLENLVRVNEANRESWKPIIFNFDHRVFPARDDEIAALIAYDDAGVPLATSAIRYYDMRGTTVHAEMTSLRGFFGADAPKHTAEYAFELTAPMAKTITGITTFFGGVWVHPRARKSGMTRLLSKLTRYYALSQRHFDCEFGFAAPPANAAEIDGAYGRAYGLEGIEPAFAIRRHGELQYGGVFAWVTLAHALKCLDEDIATWEAASKAADIRRDKKSTQTVARKR